MSPKFSADDYRFMAKALKLAKKGWYSTHPNPRVGCVIVKNGVIIAEGFHRRSGEPHAERMALASATATVLGATAYVTLEPCCHFGKTPPCTEGLIEAGISQVIIAMKDPNPLVAGKGIDQLENAGIEVKYGLLESQARLLNRGFISRMTNNRPLVRCKLASSFDGRTAMANGESVWISSEQSRRNVQFLRAESDAIMTGIGTVLHDNPSMNVRLSASELDLDPDMEVLQPLRVILDTDLQAPADARIFTLPGKVLIFHRSDLNRDVTEYDIDNVELVGVEEQDGKLDLAQVLAELARRQINEVLLETGAVLAGSAVSEQLVDELIVYQANHLMGDSARGLLHLPGISSMQERLSLTVTERRFIGSDMRLTAIFERQ